MTTKSLYVLPLLLLAIASFSFADSSSKTKAGAYETAGEIVIYSPKAKSIIAENAAIEILAGGYGWIEGPLWVPKLNALLFSETRDNEIYRWQQGSGASLWLPQSGYTGEERGCGQIGSNGLTLDRNGQLLIAQQGNRAVARLKASYADPKPDYEILAHKYQNKRLNSPNDLIVDSEGTIYFTDPPYGLQWRDEDPEQDLDYHGVYRLPRNGELELLIKHIRGVNGLALSPDESLLYVASTGMGGLRVYKRGKDGQLSGEKLLYKGKVDGMKVDTQGNLYLAAGPKNGILIMSPEGEQLALIRTGERTSNCAFGEDGSTLFMTADNYLMRVRLKSKGIGQF